MKAQADARRKNNSTPKAGDFPTIDAAVAEIKRLNDQINTIEAAYEKELAQTRKQVSQRYTAQLVAVENEQRDEFVSPQDFKEKKDTQRRELIRQRDEELARLNVTVLATSETAPLRDSIKTLSEREYIIGLDRLATELGTYDVIQNQFPIVLSSKTPSIKLVVQSYIPLPPTEAKVFKQHWLAGLVQAQAKIKSSGNFQELALVNDADSSRFIYFENAFLSPTRIIELKTLSLALAAKNYFPSTDGVELADNKMRLIWRRCAEGMKYIGGMCTGTASQFSYWGALEHAKTQARNTGLGWRVPKKDELLSIVDISQKSPLVDPMAFPGTPKGGFWSTSPNDPGYAYGAYFISFDSPNIHWHISPLETISVRLVRNIQ